MLDILHDGCCMHIVSYLGGICQFWCIGKYNPDCSLVWICPWISKIHSQSLGYWSNLHYSEPKIKSMFNYVYSFVDFVFKMFSLSPKFRWAFCVLNHPLVLFIWSLSVDYTLVQHNHNPSTFPSCVIFPHLLCVSRNQYESPAKMWLA